MAILQRPIIREIDILAETAQVYPDDNLVGTIYFDDDVSIEETFSLRPYALRQNKWSCWAPDPRDVILSGSGSSSLNTDPLTAWVFDPGTGDRFGWYDVIIEVKDSGGNVIAMETFTNKIELLALAAVVNPTNIKDWAVS